MESFTSQNIIDAVIAAARKPITARPNAIDDDTLTKAAQGDTAAQGLKESAFKAMNDENKAAKAFVTQLELSKGRRLPLAARVGLMETYHITRSILRIVRLPARAVPEDQEVLARLKKEADRIVCVGRWDRLEDLKKANFEQLFKASKRLVEATWGCFDEDSTYTCKNPRDGEVDLHMVWMMGSAVAGEREDPMTGERRHQLWWEAFPTFQKAFRLVLVGKNALAADKESLALILRNTIADVVWGFEDVNGDACWEVWKRRDLLDLLEGKPVKQKGRFLQAAEEGAGKCRLEQISEALSDSPAERYEFLNHGLNWQPAPDFTAPAGGKVSLGTVTRMGPEVKGACSYERRFTVQGRQS